MFQVLIVNIPFIYVYLYFLINFIKYLCILRYTIYIYIYNEKLIYDTIYVLTTMPDVSHEHQIYYASIITYQLAVVRKVVSLNLFCEINLVHVLYATSGQTICFHRCFLAFHICFLLFQCHSFSIGHGFLLPMKLSNLVTPIPYSRSTIL